MTAAKIAYLLYIHSSFCLVLCVVFASASLSPLYARLPMQQLTIISNGTCEGDTELLKGLQGALVETRQAGWSCSRLTQESRCAKMPDNRGFANPETERYHSTTDLERCTAGSRLNSECADEYAG